MRKMLLLSGIIFLLSPACCAEEEMKLVEIVSPKHYDSVTETRPLLKWKAYPGAHHYLLRWFEQDPISGITVKTRQNIITAATEYRFEEDMVPNRVYQWNIEAVNKDNKGMTISHCPSFITGSISQAEVERLKKEQYDKCAEIGKVLGIKVSSSGPPFSYGVQVDKIPENSAALKFSLKPFDIITGCNGEAVKSINDFYRVMQTPEGFRSLQVQRRERIGKRSMRIEKELLPLAQAGSKPSSP